MKRKQISYLDLNAIPKRPHQVHVSVSLNVGGKKQNKTSHPKHFKSFQIRGTQPVLWKEFLLLLLVP